MKLRFVFSVLLIALLLISTSITMANPFSVDAKIGILYDFDAKQVLFAQQDQEPWIPASLVKIMTLYVAFDRIAEGAVALDDIVVISEKAWRMGGSQMFLEVGERVEIEQLIRGIAIISGNDASVAIAEAMAGTEDLFVRWMNDKASALDLDLHFADVHGLSENNRITAGDFAMLVDHYLTDHPNALAYHQERSYGYQPRSRTEPIIQNNRNGLLWRYEGADGLKTGFLSKAGYNLVATAEQDNRRMIAIVLGADSERNREQEVTKLLNFGFRSFESIEVDTLLLTTEARLYKGRSQEVEFTAASPRISIPRGTRQALQIETVIEPLSAPINLGDRVGEVTISHDNVVLRRIPLVATADVARGNLLRVMFDSVILFLQNLIQRA